MAASSATCLARADPLPDAKDLFSRARDRRLAGDCAGALPLFRQAHDLYPAGLGSLRNMAECEEAVGHFASARRAWLDLRRAVLTSSDTKYEGWDEDAAHAAERLAPKLSTLTIRISAVTPAGQAAPSPGFDVRVNGQPLPPSLLGTPLERDPGQYIIRADTADTMAHAERVIDLAAGERTYADLRVVVESPPSHPAVAADRHLSAPRAAAWVAASLGAASLVGAGIAAVLRQSALEDLTNECGGSTGVCHPTPGNSNEPGKLAAIEDRGHAATTWFNILAAVSIAGLSTGAVLLVVSRSQPTSTALAVSPGGVSAWGTF